MDHPRKLLVIHSLQHLKFQVDCTCSLFLTTACRNPVFVLHTVERIQ